MNVLYIKKVRLKDKSTLSKFLYVILHIWVGGFIGIWYFFWLSLFTSVPSSLYDDSPLSYEVGCEKENAREICLQLISHDVAIFARSF